MTQSPYEGARGGVCQDCKWPNESKVAKTCDCISGRPFDWDKHQAALAEGRELRRLGVPWSDPRYYPS
jgi:hypothetical protein